MAHTMKLWERIIDHRIRQIVELDDIALRILHERYREKAKDLHNNNKI